MYHILFKNSIKVFDGAHVNNLSFIWKHGYPSKVVDNLSLSQKPIIKIFIIRDLNSWLVSMYHKPYYLQRETCCFTCFLKRKQIVNKDPDVWDVMINYKNKKILNSTDEGKTIFEIRKQKIESYLKFAQKNENCVFVKYDYIKDPSNCSKFLCAINRKYNFCMNENEFVAEIDYHCTTGQPDIKHSNYNLKIDETQQNLINQLKKDEIEKWVENLTFEMS